MEKRDARKLKLLTFVEEYCKDSNATRAAICAGFAKPSGNSRKPADFAARAAASVTGSRLLDEPEVAAMIEARQAELRRETAITREQLARELAIMAFSSRSDYRIDAEGNVTADDPELLRAVESVDYKEVGGKVRTTFRLYGKAKAADLLARMLGHLPQAAPQQNGPGVVVINGIDAALVTGEKRQSPPATTPEAT